jgi:hypothetical protein
MAHAYTPGLKVLREAKVQKTRILPLKGELRVQTGAMVIPSTVVAATKLPGNVQMVNVAGQLNVDPADVSETMLKSQGERVTKGEPLARSRGVFGLFKSTLVSPADGVVESISSVTGQVVLREAPIPVEVDAYIQGRVVEEIPSEGVVIETTGAFIQGIFGIGGERQGEIAMAVLSPDAELTTDLLDESCAGRILIGGAFLGLPALRKAIALNVAGIITGGFNYEDLRPILGYDLGVAITGSEEIATTMIVTEGFGRIAMAGRSFELLKRHVGKVASINGATQIRAGVIRPEVIIPLAAGDQAGIQHGAEALTGITEGSLVRVIRAPHFGVMGRVTALPPELATMESGTLVRTAEVELDGGERILLPRANLEMVETD